MLLVWILRSLLSFVDVLGVHESGHLVVDGLLFLEFCRQTASLDLALNSSTSGGGLNSDTLQNICPQVSLGSMTGSLSFGFSLSHETTRRFLFENLGVSFDLCVELGQEVGHVDFEADEHIALKVVEVEAFGPQSLGKTRLRLASAAVLPRSCRGLQPGPKPCSRTYRRV